MKRQMHLRGGGWAARVGDVSRENGGRSACLIGGSCDSEVCLQGSGPFRPGSLQEHFSGWQRLIGSVLVPTLWPAEGGASLTDSPGCSVFVRECGCFPKQTPGVLARRRGKEMDAEKADSTDGGGTGEAGGGLGSRTKVWGGKETQHLRLAPRGQTRCLEGLACPRRGCGDPSASQLTKSPGGCGLGTPASVPAQAGGQNRTQDSNTPVLKSQLCWVLTV